MWQLFLLILLSACISQTPKKDVSFTTEDGKAIKATYSPGKGRPLILLHMLGRDRHDWDPYLAQFNAKGPVLAVDFRGHGDSEGEWKGFNDTDFRAMVLDVKAAKRFLEGQGADVTDLTLIGGSIGANTALNYAVTDHDVKTLVLLSPGLDYRGVRTEASASKFDGRMLLLASSEDEYSADSAMRLNELSGDATLKIYNNLGHGTNMLPSKEVMKLVLGFLQK